jgi:hypothetical protein
MPSAAERGPYRRRGVAAVNVRVCCECGRRRERCRAVMKHIDGTIDYCCPACWHALDYDQFMEPRP